MKKLSVFFKQLQPNRLLTVILATAVLFISTACSSGTELGASISNPPVQAGSTNNLYKNSGDNHTSLNLSTDQKVSSAEKRADLQTISNQLVASNKDGILYPGAESPAERAEVEKSIPVKTLKDFETPQPGGEIQRQDDFGERVQDRLSAVKKTFDKASDFINEGADEALDNHEVAPTPGLNK